MTNKSGNEYSGNAERSQGKRTTVNLHGRHSAIGEVTKVRVVGRPELTNSERAREELVHLLLTGCKTLCDSPFIRALWLPQWKELKPKDPTVINLNPEFVDDITAEMKLNESQRRVVRGMVGNIPILVAHGEHASIPWNNFFRTYGRVNSCSKVLLVQVKLPLSLRQPAFGTYQKIVFG
jgi:hypothetical protein